MGEQRGDRKPLDKKVLGMGMLAGEKTVDWDLLRLAGVSACFRRLSLWKPRKCLDDVVQAAVGLGPSDWCGLQFAKLCH